MVHSQPGQALLACSLRAAVKRMPQATTSALCVTHRGVRRLSLAMFQASCCSARCASRLHTREARGGQVSGAGGSRCKPRVGVGSPQPAARS